MRFQEIFVPGGFPRYTYNPRAELQLEQKLSEARENLCKLVTVTGQTKSGKTVLAKKVFPPTDAIWIDGGTISCEDDFWQIVVDELKLFQSVEEEASKEVESNIEGSGEAEANFLIARGKGGVTAGLSRTLGSSTTTARSVSSKISAIKGLRSSRASLVVDDFHYIPRQIQGDIVRALKPLVFDGVPIVIIAIPHRRYDALKVEKEMTGRISQIEIQTWSDRELRFIPETGFGLLNYSVPDPVSHRLASESIGSPHLMQDFCREISQLLHIERSERPISLEVSDATLNGVFEVVAETIGRPIFEKLARGPRQRSDRVQRELIDGRTVDIYELVLHGLAHIRPGLVSIEYEDLRAAIKEVSVTPIPQLHEIARVLKHMSTIAATDQSSTPVLDFEEEDKKLHITDPFFAFYLRWGQLADGQSRGNSIRI